MSVVVLPIHDINPLRRRPYVTWFLVATNLVVFIFFTPVVTSMLGAETATPSARCHQQRFFEQWGAVPVELLHNAQLPSATSDQAVLDERGRAVCLSERPPTFDKSPVLSVLTSMFLHGSWVHLIGNMLFLGVFGNNVEDRMGRALYLIFYLVCGYAATYGFALFKPDSATVLVGASGAVAGVLGAYLVIFPKARVIGLVTFLFFLPFWLPAWLVLGFWFVLQYLYFVGVGVGVSDGGNVAYAAHVVGFVVGALIVLPFVRDLRGPEPPRRQRPEQRWVRSTRWS